MNLHQLFDYVIKFYRLQVKAAVNIIALQQWAAVQAFSHPFRTVPPVFEL